ncbi:MAG: rod shape-determining protein MreC [Eubacterium sp.]|nr:rod shape-determining protein MreC [Eubacterium sp.]
MKGIFKSSRFKVIIAIAGLLIIGMFFSAVTGHSESAQSGIVGTVFAPAHWVAGKISDGITVLTRSAGGNAEYDRQIDELEKEVGELEDRLADYNSLKEQNDAYREALELKEQQPELQFVDASVTGRDAADPYCTFTISKGTLSGIKDGDAVLYGKYLVGIIRKAYPAYSIVCTVLDPDFSVSAYDISTGELSYVTGDASLAGKGLCKFENLDSSTKISYGSIIASAGVSRTMPRGIVIGTVKDINDEITDISTYAQVQPGTDISKLSECLVLINYDAQGAE